MTLTLIAIGAFAATFLGGLFTLRIQDKLHLVLGFSAGAVIGVAFFDLLPEAIELAGSEFSVSMVTAIVALGFVIYMIIDRSFFAHSHHLAHDLAHDHGHDHAEEDCENELHVKSGQRGVFGASSLSVHSFLDGIAIGLAFHVSTSVGLVVALAVLAHDFSDGINTVSIIMKNGGSRLKALRWLAVDAVAPILGIVATLFFTLSDSILGIVLAIFCGFFLYMGASDLLPESHHNHPTIWTTIMSVIGIGVMYGVIALAGV